MSGRNLHTEKTAQIGVNTYGKTAISPDQDNSPPHPSSTSLRSAPAMPSHTRAERYRDVTNLKAWQVANLVDADAHASAIGQPLNMFLTVSWLLTSVNQVDSRAFGRGLRAMSQWLRNHGVSPTWLYVHENPTSDFGDDKPNTHILLYLPRKISRAEFRLMLHRWFSAFDGGVDLRPRIMPGYIGPDRLSYMCKGARQTVCWKHGWRRKRGGQGTITIKRCGTSQNIGRAARLIPSPSRKAA
jgi:hypothetical protein